MRPIIFPPYPSITQDGVLLYRISSPLRFTFLRRADIQGATFRRQQVCKLFLARVDSNKKKKKKKVMTGLFTQTIDLPSVTQKQCFPSISDKTPCGPAAAVAPPAGDNR